MILTALFVLLLGISFFIPVPQFQNPAADTIPAWKITVIALGVGFLSGLLANSGGVLYGPLFIQFLRMPTKKALASSLIVSAGLAIPGTLAHWYLGHIDWMIVLLLSASSIPFSYLGARLALTLESKVLKKIFAWMLVCFGTFDLVYTILNG